MFDMGVVSGIKNYYNLMKYLLHKEVLQLNDMKKNKPIFKMNKISKQVFLQRIYV